MKKKQLTQPQQTTNNIKYRFICQKQVHFGQSIYLSGNISQFGLWKPQNALRLNCYQVKFWTLDLQIPIQTDIQFKYFVSKTQTQSTSISPIYWIGNQLNQNFKLFIYKQDAKQIQHQRKTKDLKTMSFNIRTDKQFDKNQFSWDIRKFNCVKAIKQRFPSLIGIQQATSKQRDYLQKSLQPYYNYVGMSDKQNVDQQVGIFYDKQRFLLIQCGFRFICETKPTTGTNIGASGSTCPSLFSFAVLQDTYNSQRFVKTIQTQSGKSLSSQKNLNQLSRQLFLVQNIYLNYHATKSQKECLDMILQEIKCKKEQYKDQIRDIFVLGDFNLPQNSHLLHSIQKSDYKLQSIRKNLLRRHLKQSCDLGYTFSAFEHDEHDIQNPQKIIDHMYASTQDYEPCQFEVVRQLVEKTKHSKKQIISDHYPIIGVFRHKRNKLTSQKVLK